jgi:CheY-like chemotaxis protein
MINGKRILTRRRKPALPLDFHGQTTAAILIVEDDPGDRDLLMQAMEDAGYDFAAVGSVRAAMDLCKEEVLDLVLLDISSPEVDGRKAAGLLRRDPHWAAIPIVAITGPISVREKKTLADCGVTAMETRPIDGLSLRGTIETLLRERACRGEGSGCR